MRGLDRVSKSRSEVLVVTCIGVLKAPPRSDQSCCHSFGRGAVFLFVGI